MNLGMPCQKSLPSEYLKRPPFTRTVSSPPLSPTSLSSMPELGYRHEPSSVNVLSPLTPPTSPRLMRSHSGLDISDSSARRRQSLVTSSHPHCNCTCSGHGAKRGDDPAINECPFEVEIARDQSGHPLLFGQGVWSKVYRATGRPKRASSAPAAPSVAAALTLPPPPHVPMPLLVAVKAPLSDASRIILQNEAITLSHLSRAHCHENYIVPFYGYISSSASLVLAPVPLSLSDHIMAVARLARAEGPEIIPSDPIIGSNSTWLSLADKLITALAWLHDVARVVHGDIKPGNILLSPNPSPDPFPFNPLLIDFSSSHLLSPPTIKTTNTPNTLAAVTREYTAPELLSPAVLRDRSSTTKPESDVFSLAVTLIVAATGELMVYQGNRWQRQYMATEGFNVLEFVRNGEGGSRVPRDGLVERGVRAAVRKVEVGRINAVTWRRVIRVLRENE